MMRPSSSRRIPISESSLDNSFFSTEDCFLTQFFHILYDDCSVSSKLDTNKYDFVCTVNKLNPLIFACSETKMYILAKLVVLLGKNSVLNIAHNLAMSELSDISPVVENMQIYFFYVIGTISLIVESATLFIIITKGSALTPEFRFLSIFQQVILNWGLFRIQFFRLSAYFQLHS